MKHAIHSKHHPHRNFFFVLAILSLFNPILIPTVNASSPSSSTSSSSSTSLSRNQERVHNAWNRLVDDFDGFQNLFAHDAVIKMCLQGQGMTPICNEGTFHEMFEGYRVVFVDFQVQHKFLTGNTNTNNNNNNGNGGNDDPNDTFLVEWVNSIETSSSISGTTTKTATAATSGGGCKAIWWGYATYEFNKDGKVKRFLGMSDESADVLKCISKVSGVHTEL